MAQIFRHILKRASAFYFYTRAGSDLLNISKNGDTVKFNESIEGIRTEIGEIKEEISSKSPSDKLEKTDLKDTSGSLLDILTQFWKSEKIIIFIIIVALTLSMLLSYYSLSFLKRLREKRCPSNHIVYLRRPKVIVRKSRKYA